MEKHQNRELQLEISCPGNRMITDKTGRASVMVRIPKQTYAQLGLGNSDDIHPAFLVDGKEVEEIYISKYESCLEDGLAYSLPDRVPAVSLNFDEASKACTEKGPGWHLMTRVEWALLAQWCANNGTIPRGNCSFGKDLEESGYRAVPAEWKDGKPALVLSGTGPLEWSHDRTPAGIWDLKGNLGEWVGGTRLVLGELQILPGNDGADARVSQAADSSAWRAVSAETGELLLPTGGGETPGSLKLRYENDVWVWSAAAQAPRTETHHGCLYEYVTCDDTVCEAARRVLQVLSLYRVDPTPGAYQGDCFYAHSGAEEIFFGCGGHYKHGTEAGVFCSHGTTRRKDVSATRGFRSAYVALEE